MRHGRTGGDGAMREADLGQRQGEDDEAAGVEPEAAGRPERAVDRPGDGGSHDARQVELDRVERDRVQEVCRLDQARDHGLHDGRVERARRAGDHGDRDHVPDGDVSARGEERQRERRRREHHLCPEHDRPAARPVGDGAAQEAEREHRQVAAEADRAEQRGAAGEVVDQPAERDRLHPEADVRDERAAPEESIAARTERPEHARA